MPKTRQQKEDTLNRINEKLDNLKGGVLVNFEALEVNDDQKLRSDLRKDGVEYEVVKKTLLKKAFSAKGFEIKDWDSLKGNLGLVVSAQDEVRAAKIIDEFSQDNENYNIIGGFLGNKWIDATQVIALAKLPSKAELIAKTIATIKAPITGLVNVLVGNLRGLVGVLNAIKNQK